MKNREQLETLLQNKIVALKSKIEDKEFADSCIEAILSLKEQLDVEPTEIYVPTKDVIKEYVFGNYRLIRTKNEIIFSANGYKVIVKPWQFTLYGNMNYMLDLEDRKGELEEEEKGILKTLENILPFMLFFPAMAFIKANFTADVYKYIIERSAKMMEGLLEEAKERPVDEEIETLMQTIGNVMIGE